MKVAKKGQKLSDNQKGLICGLLTALTFSIYALINRYVYLNYEVDTFSYVVTFLAAGGLFAAIGLAASYRRQAFKLFDKNVAPVVLNGVIAGIGLGLFVFGQGYTTAINATILATATVITTVLYSKLLLKEALSPNQQLWLLFMFIGLYLAIVGTHIIHLNKGDLIVITSSLILGFNNAFSKILMRKHSSGFISDVRLVSGGLLFVVLGLILRGSDMLVTSAGLWPLFAGFFFWLTIKFFYATIRYTNPNKAIVLANSHPIFTPIAGVFLLGEPYNWSKFAGSVLILVSIYFISKKNGSRSPA